MKPESKPLSNVNRGNKIKKIYFLLNKHFGDLKWWPADNDFEVVVGTILTQNTSWINVEKAISKLKKKGALTPKTICGANINLLSEWIRSAGYFNVKAQRLKEISRFVERECGGKLAKLRDMDISLIRDKLLSVKGVGPETADCILVYALKRPVFVVDAYTKRIFFRHGIVRENCGYDDVQIFVHNNFDIKTSKLNQFHALLVETGKNFCKKTKPRCDKCPLKSLLNNNVN